MQSHQASHTQGCKEFHAELQSDLAYGCFLGLIPAVDLLVQPQLYPNKSKQEYSLEDNTGSILVTPVIGKYLEQTKEQKIRHEPEPGLKRL